MSDTRASRSLTSSTVSVGVVTTFLVLTSLAGFVDEVERPAGTAHASTLGSGWSLRGTLAPTLSSKR